MYQVTGVGNDAERIQSGRATRASHHPEDLPKDAPKDAIVLWDERRKTAWLALAGCISLVAFGAAASGNLFALMATLLSSEVVRVALPTAFGLAAWVATQRPRRHPAAREESFPVVAFGERSEGFLEFAEKVLFDAGESEQQRIRHTLEVGLSRQLEGISCLSRILENRLAGEGRPEAKDAARIRRLADQAIADAHSLADSAYPPGIQTEGLEKALNNLAATAEPYQVYCQVLVDGPLPDLERSASVQIYRMVEMMVKRAIRHGNLHYILVELSAEGGQQLALSVTDRVGGGSFPGLESHETHLLRARARSIKGTIDIERRVYGCRLICTAPLGYVASS